MQNEVKIISEWLNYVNCEDKKEAEECLLAWKKFCMKKISPEYEFVGERWVDKPSWTDDLLHKPATLALNIFLKSANAAENERG